ncbi:hypothetical protein FGF1_33210 [Flavobacteriaceae bacterium GF1]
MFTRLTVLQRIQIGLVLAFAFLLVLGSNRLDQKHFSTIQTTVNSVYKDRVVVQDFIYQLNNIFHQKELQLLVQKGLTNDHSANKKVNELLVNFERTKLTSKEAQMLNELNLQFEKLKGLESGIEEPKEELSGDVRIQMANTFDHIQITLDGLAQIQLDESGELTKLSNKSLGMDILLSKLEVGFLIIIGIVLLALIFSPARSIQTVDEN